MRIGALLILCISLSFCQKEDTGHHSYRYDLWKNMVESGWQFDLVGTKIDEWNYPTFMGLVFDANHEGTGGIQTSGILNELPGVLNSIDTPDVVLIGIGGNDLTDGGEPVPVPVANINEIIDILQSQNPNIFIFLEKIAPLSSEQMTSEFQSTLNNFNSQIDMIAQGQSDSMSTVIAVDMFSGFNDSHLTSDGIHYNEQGAKFVADRYYWSMQLHLDQGISYKILCLGDSRVEGGRN